LSPICPADNLVPAGTQCRASTGECDPAEACTGSSVTCPGDAKTAAGTACTSDGNPCTLDQCDGSSGACQHPAGNAGATCRNSTGECDPAEACTGSSPACPADAKKPDGSACTEDGNVCTADECVAGLCTHLPKLAGTACGSQSSTDCDHPNTCDGIGNCQANNAANGTPCDEGDVCTSPDTCQAGACTPGPVVGGCMVTGGGQLTTGGDKISFGLNARSTGIGSFKGQIEYHNHTKKTTYHSLSITSLMITSATSCLGGQKATIEGQIQKKGDTNPLGYVLVAEDCGEPGRNDTFYMSMTDGESSGTGPRRLDKGNIQVH